jgi:hypothetical protein
MRDYMCLGNVPCCEDGIPMNKDGHRAECKRFAVMLDEIFINKPENAYFSIKANPHEYGTYYEVAINFDDDCPESEQFAYFVESNTPQYWTETDKIDWKAPKESILREKIS